MAAIQFMPASDQTGAVQAAGGTSADAKSLKMQGMQAAFSNYLQRGSNGAQTAIQPNKNTAGQGQTAQAQGNSSQVQQQYERQQSQSAVQADKVSGPSNDASTLDENAAGAVEEAVEEITEAIEENLGVDEEQLQAAMELLGLTQQDLLQAQNLIALTVELTGSENAGMMLFDANFQNLMQEASAITDGLLKELGLTMEELMGKLQNADGSQMDHPQDLTGIMEDAAAQTPETVPQAPQDTASSQTAGGQAETGSAAQQAAQAGQPQEAQSVQEAAGAVPNEEAAAVQEVQGQPQEDAQPQEETAKQQAGQNTQMDTENSSQANQQGSTDPDGETGGQPFEKDAAQRKDVREQNAEAAGSRGAIQDAPRFDFTSHIQQPGPTAPAAQSVSAQIPMPQVNMQDVISQIVEYTKVNLSEEVKSIEMQLNPENLGKIYLHVSEKQGTVTAQITAQNENMKEALIQQAVLLKETLNQQGVRVDAVEVSAGTHEFENNLERDAHSQEEQARQQEEQNSRRSRRSINLRDMDDLDGLSGLMSDEEALVARIMRDNGNNVDYRA